MPRRESGRTERLVQLALLTSAALIIFVIEQQIPNPVPIPGAKLGLANIITVYAVHHYRPHEVLALLLTRIFLGSVFGGTFMSVTMIFSLSGGMLCLAGMLLLKPLLGEKNIWLGSIFGAVFHNTGQTIAAIFVMKTAAVVSYFPFLVLTGCIAGAFTGLTAQMIVGRVRPKH